MVIIFGLGFTGIRLARRLLARKVETSAVVRNADRFRDLEAAGLRLFDLERVVEAPPAPPEGAIIALLIPPLVDLENTRIRQCIGKSKPRRIVYVSSTGVYGAETEINEESVATPDDARGFRRIEEERWVSGGPWSSLILRAAAIYGPGRGVQAALRQGRVPRGSDSSVVSRVHVDDLAGMVDAGLFSAVAGAWPVADEEPSPTAEIVRWCLERQGMKSPGDFAPSGSMRGRRVDGRKIREILGVELKYPSWKSGVPASLTEENTG